VILEAARRSPASDGLLVRPRTEADEHVRPLTVSEQCPVRARKGPQRQVGKLLPRLHEVALTTRRNRPCCVCPDAVHDAILYRAGRRAGALGAVDVRSASGVEMLGTAPMVRRRYMREQWGARAAWPRLCSCATLPMTVDSVGVGAFGDIVWRSQRPVFSSGSHGVSTRLLRKVAKLSDVKGRNHDQRQAGYRVRCSC
jgi:hypothetical protein